LNFQVKNAGFLCIFIAKNYTCGLIDPWGWRCKNAGCWKFSRGFNPNSLSTRTLVSITSKLQCSASCHIEISTPSGTSWHANEHDLYAANCGEDADREGRGPKSTFLSWCNVYVPE